MRYLLEKMALAACFIATCWNMTCVAQALPKALIVYDQKKDSLTEKMGMASSIMLENLLGHFNGSVTRMALQDYRAGKTEEFDVIFYLGSEYDNLVPEAFLRDVNRTKKTVAWFKYNLWQITRSNKFPFTKKFGFTFQAVRGMNAKPSLQDREPGFFDRIQYKGFNLDKYYRFYANTVSYVADPDMGMVNIVDGGKAKVIASVINRGTGETIPYIIKSANFWYFADIPLSFIGPRDRYLVLADVLHDIVGVQHAERHVAMVRLEDVSAVTSVAGVDAVTRYLQQKGLPFSVAAIPHYRDPFGVHSKGIPVDIPLARAESLKTALRTAVARGGEIVMHGYTHQYDGERNPHSGVSGEDYEFWNVRTNGPVAEDSIPWALARVREGLAEFKSNGFTPVAWGTPHYRDSPNSIKAVSQVFGTTYQRSFYYTSDTPNLALAKGRDIAADQFFPYEIQKDHYGRRIIPENLGNVRYATGRDELYNAHGEDVYTWNDIYLNARYAAIVRDGYASFFFHPYLADPKSGVNGMRDFQSLVEAISKLGYTWASPRSLTFSPSGAAPVHKDMTHETHQP